jgi:hypothetical protein
MPNGTLVQRREVLQEAGESGSGGLNLSCDLVKLRGGRHATWIYRKMQEKYIENPHLDLLRGG